MYIEELKIKQARELSNIFNAPTAPQGNPLIGKYCVFRGYRHGVYVGKFAAVHMLGNVAYAEVQDARRMQYQKYNGFTLSSVATEGIGKESKLSPAVPVHFLQLSDDAEIFSISSDSERSCREQCNG